MRSLLTVGTLTASVLASSLIAPVAASSSAETCDDHTLESDRQAFGHHLVELPDCYSYTLVRDCNCVAGYTGPFEIRVVHGTIVSDAPTAVGLVLPTMQDLYQQISDTCFRDCSTPCDVYQREHGSIRYFRAFQNPYAADKGVAYKVTDFAVETCPAENETAAVTTSSNAQAMRKRKAIQRRQALRNNASR
jgi:hypothetical protein